MTTENHFTEPNRDLEITDRIDIIVCGAGPAGVSAAIAAARSGASVRLFEAHGCLGGVWTAGLLGYLLDFDKPGFAFELATRLRERDVLRGPGMVGLSYEPEEMKILLEELCLDAGVQIQLHTRVCAAYRNGSRLSTIVTESKSGRQAWQADVFIDATGDGDLSALAGCDWSMGEPSTGVGQPMSMTALLAVKDSTRLAEFIHPPGAASAETMEATKVALLAEIRRAGLEPSYAMPTLFPIRDNLLLAMVNHEYGVEPYDAAQVTAATVRARREIHAIVHGLRGLGGPWAGIQIAATPEQIGTREGRRIRGRYTVSTEDLIAGARHVDSVTRPAFNVDIHGLSQVDNEANAYTNAGVNVKPYDIPLRALIAADVDGLMMAGRCISGDFIAHASYRVTGNAVAMGEAAGAVCALATRDGLLPHEVEWAQASTLIDKLRSEHAQ